MLWVTWLRLDQTAAILHRLQPNAAGIILILVAFAMTLALLKFELTELMEAGHPHDPHYFLWFVAVVPDAQGHGLGAQLMAPVLARCDLERTPAYLEATSERNATLYARHGFEVIGEITPSGGPTMYPMWREPRA